MDLEIVMFVKIVVVEIVKDLIYSLFHLPEINSHAKTVQFSSLNGNLNFPIVTMGPFAIPRIITQMVPG